MEDAGIAGEAVVPGAFGAVADEGVIGPAVPFFEVPGPGDADLLVPSAAFAAGQVLRFGVVEDVIEAVVLEDAGFVEAALLPGQGIGVVGAEAGRVEFPVMQVVAPAEADDGRAGFIAGTWIGVPGAEIAAIDFAKSSGREDTVFPHDPHHGDVVAGDGVFGVAVENAAVFFPVDEVMGSGEAGLVADAVEADEGHVIAAVVQEDEGAVDGFFVEIAWFVRGAEDKLFVLIGCFEIVRCGEVRIWIGMEGGRKGGRKRESGGALDEETAA